jgi:hypothetical protein
MRTDIAQSPIWWRRLVVAAIAALGVMAIVGSGGGGFPDGPNFNGPYPPSVRIEPSRVTVQVGATVTYAVRAGGDLALAYQWRRNGVDIAGATGATYTLVGANLADDGVQFSVSVTNSVGVGTASSLLRVTSTPGLVYQDGEFRVSDWAVSVISDPPQNGPTHAESQAATGGNPGAFRSVTVEMPQGPSSIRVFHTALSATYDPALQGAIYTIDLAQDCNRLSNSTLATTTASPMFQQGERRFAPVQWDTACAPVWQTDRVSSLTADEFVLIEGPACTGSESCPDFSATAAPMRFGLVSGVDLSPGTAAGFITQGIDNWTLTVWRR